MKEVVDKKMQDTLKEQFLKSKDANLEYLELMDGDEEQLPVGYIQEIKESIIELDYLINKCSQYTLTTEDTTVRLMGNKRRIAHVDEFEKRIDEYIIE